MIKESKRFVSVLKELHDTSRIIVIDNKPFSKIMRSNSDRLDFLNFLLDMSNQGELSEDCEKLLKDNIDFISDFIKGKYNTELSVSKRYFEDREDNLIVPSDEELDYLFKLIEENIRIFNLLYKDNGIVLKLPDDSFNQNMIRILKIEEKNLAHLMGLNDSKEKEKSGKENTNLLLKHFRKEVENPEKYGDTEATQYLNWFISEEGKTEIKRINRITQDFIKEDKIENPSSYDELGNPKNKDKFIARYKKATSLEFPFIKFSRYITKCINNLNYMNLYSINQMILDYTSKLNKRKEPMDNNEKDIFILNTPVTKLVRNAKYYSKIYKKIDELIEIFVNKYGANNEKIENFLKEQGINTQSDNIKTYINLSLADSFIGKQGINPDQSEATREISDSIGQYFSRDIHLIGFNTVFDVDESNHQKITNLSESSINYAHCDTSIAISIGELFSKYYKYGRPFFIDFLENTSNEILRISNPVEEIRYYELQEEFDEEHNYILDVLNEKLNHFSDSLDFYLYKEKEETKNHNKER